MVWFYKKTHKIRKKTNDWEKNANKTTWQKVVDGKSQSSFLLVQEPFNAFLGSLFKFIGDDLEVDHPDIFR